MSGHPKSLEFSPLSLSQMLPCLEHDCQDANKNPFLLNKTKSGELYIHLPVEAVFQECSGNVCSPLLCLLPSTGLLAAKDFSWIGEHSASSFVAMFDISSSRYSRICPQEEDNMTPIKGCVFLEMREEGGWFVDICYS